MRIPRGARSIAALAVCVTAAAYLLDGEPPPQDALIWRPKTPAKTAAAAVDSFFTTFLGQDRMPSALSAFTPTGEDRGEFVLTIQSGDWESNMTVSVSRVREGWAVRHVRTPDVELLTPKPGDFLREPLVVEGRARAPSGVVTLELKPAAIPGGTIRLGLWRAQIPPNSMSPFSIPYKLGATPKGVPLVLIAYVSPDHSSPWEGAFTAIPVSS